MKHMLFICHFRLHISRGCLKYFHFIHVLVQKMVKLVSLKLLLIFITRKTWRLTKFFDAKNE